MIKKKPLILITNDDSLYSTGLESLVYFIKDIADVIVVAPLKLQSAMSNALTVRKRVKLYKIGNFENISWYGTTGTPSDAIKIAFNIILNKKPDLVLSGINHGNNYSVNSFYSGTLAGALEGLLKETNSISFSLNDYSFGADFSHCKKWVIKIVVSLLKHNENNICLNVNIPKVSDKEIRGIKVVRQSHGRWDEKYEEQKSNNLKEKVYFLRGEHFFHENKKGTDVVTLLGNFVSVSPIVKNLTEFNKIDFLKKILE